MIPYKISSRCLVDGGGIIGTILDFSEQGAGTSPLCGVLYYLCNIWPSLMCRKEKMIVTLDIKLFYNILNVIIMSFLYSF